MQAFITQREEAGIWEELRCKLISEKSSEPPTTRQPNVFKVSCWERGAGTVGES